MDGRRKRGGKRPSRRGGLVLRPVSGGDFELEHPRCVAERELDYAEGIELWKAGDPEAARDALRYALDGCGDNLWVHVALGRMALDVFRDPALARGHFGYAVELVERVLPQQFQGRLPRERPANRPFFEALAGLAVCYETLGNRAQANELRTLADRLDGRLTRRGASSARPPLRRGDPGGSDQGFPAPGKTVSEPSRDPPDTPS
jgi:hypothetical protein